MQCGAGAWAVGCSSCVGTQKNPENELRFPSNGLRVALFRPPGLFAPMPTRAWFPTLIYHEPLLRAGLERFNSGLAEECRHLRDYDTAGRKWSAKNYPGGYTSYASLNQLHKF